MDRPAIDTLRLNEVMKEKGMTAYKLAKLTNISQSSMDAIRHGKFKPDYDRARIIADELGANLFDIFPYMKVVVPELVDISKGKEYDPRELIDEKTVEGKEMQMTPPERVKIGIEQMMDGHSNIAPENGYRVKSRRIITMDGDENEGLNVCSDEQVCILTGIKAQGLNVDRMFMRTDLKLIMENEFHFLPHVYTRNGELMLVGYCHGKPAMIYRGRILGELCFF